MNQSKSSRYHRQRRWLSVLALGVSAALLAALLLTGFAIELRQTAGGSVAGFTILLVALQEIVTFPLTVYSGFVLERRYDLSTQTFGGWLRDHLKAAALGAALAVGGAEVVYAAIRHVPGWWWLVSAAAFGAVFALLARLTPTLLLPLFFRFEPLGRESLRDRLMALCRRTGVPVLGAYEWGLGAKTRRANAALVGTGHTRRILLSDTLLADYSDDEIEVILAHELAHHVHHDILKGLAVESILLLAGFLAAARALAAAWEPLGLSGPSDPAGLPVLLLAGGAVSLLAAPVLHALSRRNERRADRFALDATDRPEAFVSAMRRLGAQNLAEEKPSRVVRWLFHSHPPIEERIERARAWKKSA